MIKQRIQLSVNASLAEQVEQIILNDLKKATAGDRVLPERALAEKYDVSRKTVRQAINKLTDKGLLERKVGRGTFVSGNTNGLPSAMLNFAGSFPYKTLEKVLYNVNRKKELITCTHFYGDYRSVDIYLESIQQIFNADKKLDIICVDEGSLPNLIVDGIIEPIDKLLDDSNGLKRDKFHPSILEALSHNGHLYAIPQVYSTMVLFYNKKLMKKFNLGFPDENWTWDEVLEAAETLTVIDETTEKNIAYGLGTFQSSINTFMPFIYQNIPPELSVKNSNIFKLPETVGAFQKTYDLIYRKRCCPFFQNDLQISSPNMFMEEGLGMFVGQYSDYLILEQKCDFPWGVTFLPQGKRRNTSLPTQGWAISVKSSDKKKSFKAIEALMAEENTKILCDELFRGSAYETRKSKLPEVFINSLNFATPSKSAFPLNAIELTKYFLKELCLMLNNFEEPEAFCQKISKYFDSIQQNDSMKS
jgi:ABC-type glycerol-3-phosphate transport system substrate-binding protein/DNA-binding transcriptional regulator YhcF (GntR family)